MLSRRFQDRIIHFLKPARTIPQMPWTGNGRWDLSIPRVLVLFFGLAIFGIGDSLLIQSHIGNAPWSVLAQGISRHSPLSIGQATFAISAAVLIFWWPLKERPGFGTLMNILVIATLIQVGVDHIPKVDNNLPIQLLYVLGGISLVGAGTAFYITCGLGPGPRDGLMTALHRRTGVRVGRVRLLIEVTALLVGWALGGRLGIGTAMFALLIGNSIATNLNLVAKLSNR
jgi:uncharacterized membrane protein YczE